MVALFYVVMGILYTSLQGRYIFGGDSAEYSTVAKIWGIAHPPGYPLYSFLINILNRAIPFGTTPWRVAFLSSIPTIITAYIIFKLFRLLKVHPLISLLTSAIYLFLFPIWLYGLVPEVFALHTMFVSIITYLLLLYSKKSKKNYILVAALLCGLSVSHHHIFVLFIPGWIYLVKDKIKKVYSDKKLFLSLILLLLLGMSFYLYAVIASVSGTILDWTNAKTPLGLFQLVTRSTYGSFKAYAGAGANIPNQLADILSSFVFVFLDFKPLGIVFIAFGIYACRKISKQFSVFLLISLIIHLFFLFYTNFVLSNSFSDGMYERFLIPLYFILVFFVGFGMHFLFNVITTKMAKLIKNKRLKYATNMILSLFLCAFVFLIALQSYKVIALVPSLQTFDQFGKDIMATLPRGSILSTQGDNSTFASYYYLYGLKARNDISFAQVGLMGNEYYIQLLKKRSPSLIIQKPITESKDFIAFITANKNKEYFTDGEMGFGAWRPYGVLWKYYPSDEAAASDSARLLAENKRLWETVYKMPNPSAEEKNIFHANTVVNSYIGAYDKYSQLLVILGHYSDAEKVLKDIAEIYRKGDPQSEAIYMNLLVYEKKCTEATEAAEKVNLDATVKLYPTFVKSALPYLKTCHPQDARIPSYQKIQDDLGKKAKTTLNAF